MPYWWYGVAFQAMEGVTQGCPLGMILYVIALLPLIELAWVLEPKALQAWFADDSAACGTLEECASMVALLKEKGPAFGYHVSPEKSW